MGQIGSKSHFLELNVLSEPTERSCCWRRGNRPSVRWPVAPPRVHQRSVLWRSHHRKSREALAAAAAHKELELCEGLRLVLKHRSTPILFHESVARSRHESDPAVLT